MNTKISNEKEAQRKKSNSLKIWLSIGLSICILTAGMSLIFCSSIALKESTEIKPIVEINPKNTVIKQYNHEAACIDWILKRSSKISRDTAIDIFKIAMSTDHGLLLIALASRESSFNPSAISKAGAIGLNQIMPNIWVKELKENKIIKEKRDLFNYEANLKASNYILTKYYKKTGSWEKTLKKYVGANSESYVKDVLANCGELYLLNKVK